MAAELANAAPVELPPSMKASVAFRCKDNSLAFVDFFSGDKLANLRTKKDGEIIRLTAENAGDPLTADGGYKLTGDQNAITLTTPAGGTQTCKHCAAHSRSSAKGPGNEQHSAGLGKSGT